MRKKPLFSVITLVLLSTSLCDPSARAGDGPMFEGKDTLLRPKNYREWVFVGSSLGLRYDKNPQETSDASAKRFNNVYLNPAAYREYVRAGKFPDGTMLVLEIASAERKKEPGLQGSFQKEFVALEASVKDSRRFEGGWAYFSFDGKDGQRKESAQPFVQSACFDCHRQKAATDNVFTQFYPVLRTNREK